MRVLVIVLIKFTEELIMVILRSLQLFLQQTILTMTQVRTLLRMLILITFLLLLKVVLQLKKLELKENLSNNFRYTSRVNETTEIKSNQKFIQDDNGDYDNDGVLNSVDQCPDSPEGSTVDVNGCPVFTLPLDNNKVSVTSASCIGNTDGSIGISVEDESYNYTVTVTGQDDPITH
jgi:hypothetical protein